MTRHLIIAITLICALALPAHAAKVVILEEGDSVPACESWEQEEAVEITKVFGPTAEQCTGDLQAYRFRCTAGAKKGLWKVRCE